jgi:subtilisin family serine protease
MSASSREYVILTRPDRTLPVTMGARSRSSESQEQGKFDVSIQKLTEREALEIKRDPNRCSAAAMPLQLIEPLSRMALEGTQAQTPWGLEAIGATTSKLAGDGIVVAVLDTGIDRKHEAFSHIPPERLEERDFTNEGDGDSNGHGTHCAGTIFGSTINGVRIGIAPKVERALVGKVLGSHGASTTTLLSAIQWAIERGAHVVSMSLGLDFPGYSKRLVADGYPVDLATSKALEAYRENTRLFDALDDLIRAAAAFRQPTILVAAAGNASRRDGNPEHTIFVEPPAASDGIVSVGALAKIDGGFRIAPFSNTGPMIVAPGVEISSARAGGGMALMSGTSMAGPHVAGGAVLWAEYQIRMKRRLTAEILKSKLTGTAIPVDGVDQSDIGSGLVRVPPND